MSPPPLGGGTLIQRGGGGGLFSVRFARILYNLVYGWKIFLPPFYFSSKEDVGLVYVIEKYDTRSVLFVILKILVTYLESSSDV